MSEVFPLTPQMGWTSLSLGAFLLVITTVILVVVQVLGKAKVGSAQLNAVKTEWNAADKASYPPVEPLPDFRWQDTEPLKLRPFKPSYNLTMAISKSNVSELVEMDYNYLSRVTLRKQLMATETETILATQDSVKEAVDEFYTWMMGTYLPTRFPRSFKITSEGQRLHNLVTGDISPLKSPDLPIDALRILGGTIDDDLLFLLPSPDGDGYTLQGFVNCFPGGFDTRAKFNMKLRDIHIPVPSYKEKLEKSMDKFFDRIEVGTFVKRANWSINTNENLFIKVGNHAYANDEERPEDINPATTFLRCERQCLHRLPKSKALLLSVKTFLYPMSELKAEGFADDLIAAIDGLKTGNAPGMHFYKRAGMWGDSLKAYLKS